RDRNVTGVQTCALPISDDLHSLFHAELTRYRSLIERLARAASTPASPSTTIANIYEAREQAQMAVHVAHRLINGRFEGSGQVGQIGRASRRGRCGRCAE